MSFPRYERYRDSGVEWLGEVPEHWKSGKLHQIAILNPAKSELGDFDPETTISFLPMEALGSSGDPSLALERTLSEVETGYTYFRDGDVAFAKVTPCFENGKRAIFSKLTNGVGFGTTELIVIRAKSAQSIPKFLYWFVATSEFLGLGEGSMYGAGGLKRIPDSFVHQFPTCFPGIDEQTSIAGFLDQETAKIDALIEEQRRLVELLKEKRQAVISHVITKGVNHEVTMRPSGISEVGEIPEHWEVGPLKRYFLILDGARIPLSAEERGARPGAFPYYGASGVIDSIDEFIFKEDLVLVSEDGANLLNRSTPIAFVARGKYWVNNHAHILRPLDGRSAFWAERIEAINLTPVVTGSAQPKLTIDALMNLRVAVPPEPEERRLIEDSVQREQARIDRLITEAEGARFILKERRSALISAAVTGKIDVRNHSPKESA